jgi:hypothetical protein
MSEYEVREAYPDDFRGVLPLLRKLPVRGVTDERWHRLFSRPWQSRHEHCGYLLSRNGHIAGFLGALFSERTMDGRTVSSCNMTSWVVEPEARGQSVSMLSRLLHAGDDIITNFSPSPTVVRVLEAMKFTEVSRTVRALYAVPSLAGLRITVETRPDVIAGSLDGRERRIMEDHRDFECLHALADGRESRCYMILKRMKIGRWPYLRLHYASDAEALRLLVDGARTRLCARHGAIALLVDERYLTAKHFRAARELPAEARWFYRGAPGVNPPTDSLYSELVLLHA